MKNERTPIPFFFGVPDWKCGYPIVITFFFPSVHTFFVLRQLEYFSTKNFQTLYIGNISDKDNTYSFGVITSKIEVTDNFFGFLHSFL